MYMAQCHLNPFVHYKLSDTTALCKNLFNLCFNSSLWLCHFNEVVTHGHQYWVEFLQRTLQPHQTKIASQFHAKYL